MPPQVVLISSWVTDAAILIAHISLGSLVLGIALLLAVAVYRLFFHPLSRIPGPRLAAVTNGWLAYNVRNGRMLQLGKTLHADYGPAVRVGPNEVWFNTKDAFRLIYSKSTLVALSCRAYKPARHASLVFRMPLHHHKLTLDQALPMAMKNHPFTVRDTTPASSPLAPRGRRTRGGSRHDVF
jgi:hypothetical protein